MVVAPGVLTFPRRYGVAEEFGELLKYGGGLILVEENHPLDSRPLLRRDD
jgi:hypothetical protein